VSQFTPEFLDVINNFVEAARNDTEAICLVATRIAKSKGSVSADDIVEAMEINRDRRIIGGALGRLKKEGVLRIDGFMPTKRKSSHGRPIYIYKLAENWERCWPTRYLDPSDIPVRGLDGNVFIKDDNNRE
jgi:predicted ArsR family transcriptional regulator